MFGFSHEQADAKQEFNINMQTLANNLQQLSLVSQKLIHDTLLAQEVKPHTYEVTNGLVVICKQGYSRYVATLEKEQSEVSTIS